MALDAPADLLPSQTGVRARMLALDSDAMNPADPTAGDADGCVCAVLSNRQREVGFAALEPASHRLVLTQFCEGGKSAAAITAMMLHIYDVTAIVVIAPKGRQGEVDGRASDLMNQLEPHLPQEVHELPRSAFDDTKGRDKVSQLASAESWSKVARVATSQGLYLAFGAAGALLTFLQTTGQHLVLANSLNVELVGTNAHLRLSAGSLDCLEILPCHGPTPQPAPSRVTNTQKASGPDGAVMPPAIFFKPHLAHRSLLDLMNHTRTSVGARLVRASLLQPLTDTAALNMRYDAVEELMQNQKLQLDLAQVLVALPKRLDKLCGNLAGATADGGVAKSDASRRISTCITSILLMRSALQLVPRLAECLDSCHSQLLQAVCSTCTEPEFATMLDQVQQVMDPDATTSSSAFVNRIQQCFAVRQGADSMLDVARTSFCRITEKVHAMADQYKHSLSTARTGGAGGGSNQQLAVKVNYTERNGFYLGISWADCTNTSSLQDVVLPRTFLPLGKRSRTAILATTHELNALNARLNDMAHDCLVLTEQVMSGLIQHMLSHMSLLLRFVDNVALADMLLGFAQLAASSPHGSAYCRPTLMDEGHAIVIEQGRHPLLEHVQGCDVKANSTPLDGDCSSLHLITGPNMAGKTTYLKQVGLLVIMAQAGSFVPAASMLLRPVQQLFVRMGHGDNIETNSSSFMVEMQEISHVLDQADDRSLVLIDELGRATSTLDGVAICWAVCEALLASRTPTVLATHFAQLTDLATMYPRARVWQLQVQVQGNSLEYLRQMKPAERSDVWGYGLALARTLGFPEPLLAEADRVATDQRPHFTPPSGVESKQHLVLALASQLASLALQLPQDLLAGPQDAGRIPESTAGLNSGVVSALLQDLRALKEQAKTVLGSRPAA